MTNSALVSTTFKSVSTATISSTSGKKIVNKSTEKKPPSSRNKVTKIRVKDGFRESKEYCQAYLIFKEKKLNNWLQISLGYLM